MRLTEATAFVSREALRHNIRLVRDLVSPAELLAVVKDDSYGHGADTVVDVLPGTLAAGGASVVYAAGPPALMRLVSEVAEARDLPSQVAVEAATPCATGLCGTCVVPVRSDGGADRWARSSVEGPVLRGDQVRWQDWKHAGGWS